MENMPMEQFSDQLLISDFSPCPRPRGYLRETGDFSYNTRACALAPPTSPDYGFFCTRAYDPSPSTSPDYGFFSYSTRAYDLAPSSPGFTKLGILRSQPPAVSYSDAITSEVFGQLA